MPKFCKSTSAPLPRSSIKGMPRCARQRHQFGGGRLLGEAGDFKIRSMHAQQQPRALGDGFFVVADARAIGGAHFAKRCAGFRHHIRDAERSADLDQFPARDDHLAAFGQRVQRQQDRGSIVVYDDGRDRRRRSAGLRLANSQAAVHVSALTSRCETGDRRERRACRGRRPQCRTRDWKTVRQFRECAPARPRRAERGPDSCAG